MKKPSECTHADFNGHLNVVRIEDAGRYVVEIKVSCAECGEPFRFLGVPAGMLNDRPACSVDGLQLIAPIEPEIEKKFHTHLRYEIPPKVEHNS